MKVIIMKSFREFLSTNYFKHGAFIELKFTKETLENLQKYFNKNNIQNQLNLDEIHTTLLYSRKGIVDYIPSNVLKGEILTPIKLHIWKTQEDTNCLVCELHNNNVIRHHNNLIKNHNASHDYPEYIPHVTFSYNCGNIDLDQLELPDFNFIVENEALSSLDEDWLKNNIKKR